MPIGPASKYRYTKWLSTGLVAIETKLLIARVMGYDWLSFVKIRAPMAIVWHIGTYCLDH